MCKLKLFIGILLLLNLTALYARKDDTKVMSVTDQEHKSDSSYKNSISAEIGGTGVVNSVNYERLIQLTPKVALAPRVGIGNGLLFLNGIGELNCIIGTNHAIETGAGICITGKVTFLEIDDYAPYQYTLRLGYRYTKKRAYIRMAPMLMIDATGDRSEKYGIWGALAWGYSF